MLLPLYTVVNPNIIRSRPRRTNNNNNNYNNNNNKGYNKYDKQMDFNSIVLKVRPHILRTTQRDIFSIYAYHNMTMIKIIIVSSVLQLPMQSVPITTDVVSSNLDQGEVYNIM